MKILLQIYHSGTHYIEELLYMIAKRSNNHKHVVRWGKFSFHRVNVLLQITSLDRDRIDDKLSRLKREEGV